MSAGTVRWLYDNLVRRPGTVITPSSQDPTHPAEWLKDQGLEKVLRSNPGWNVGAHNDAVPFLEGAYKTIGFLQHGNYPTGDAYTAAFQAAMNAAGRSPKETGSLKAWYRADWGVTVDGDGIVQEWKDASGNLRHLTLPSGGAAQPLFIEGARNGRPAIRLRPTRIDGTSTYNLKCVGEFANLFDASGDGTVIAVIKLRSQTSSFNQSIFYRVAGNSNGLTNGLSAGTFYFYTHDGTFVYTTKAGTAGAWAILLWERDSDTTLYAGIDDLDTAALGTLALGGANPNMSGDLGIGGVGTSASDPALGDLAELFICSGALSEAWRQSLVDYLEAKYDLSTATGDGSISNTYAVTYGATTKKVTMARATGSATPTLQFGTGTHHEQSVAPDAGFFKGDHVGTSITGELIVTKGQEHVALDFRGELAMAPLDILPDANDALDFQEASPWSGFIAPRRYEDADDIAAALVDLLDVRSGYNAGGAAGWFRSDEGAVLASDGVTVTGWYDQGGAGRHLEAIGSPILVPNVVNGRPAIYFDGTCCFRSLAACYASLFDATGDGTVLAVIKWPDFQASPGAIYGSDAAGYNKLWVPGTPYDYLAASTWDGAYKQATKGDVRGPWRIVCWQRDADTTIYSGYDDLNTADLISTALGGGYTVPADKLLIGAADSPTTNRLVGYIAEILFLNSSVSELNRQRRTGYLRWKYALSNKTDPASSPNTHDARCQANTKRFVISIVSGSTDLSLKLSTGPHADTNVLGQLGFELTDTPLSTDPVEATYPPSLLNARNCTVLGHNAEHGGQFTLQASAQSAWHALHDPDVIHVLSGDDSMRGVYWSEYEQYPFWVLKIDDQTNPDGYSEVGVLWLSNYFQPALNPTVGLGIVKNRMELTEIAYADHGAHTRAERPTRETRAVGYKLVPNSEAATWEEIAEFTKIGRNLLLDLEPITAPTKIMYGFFPRGLDLEYVSPYYWRLPTVLFLKAL